VRDSNLDDARVAIQEAVQGARQHSPPQDRRQAERRGRDRVAEQTDQQHRLAADVVRERADEEARHELAGVEGRRDPAGVVADLLLRHAEALDHERDEGQQDGGARALGDGDRQDDEHLAPRDGRLGWFVRRWLVVVWLWHGGESVRRR